MRGREAREYWDDRGLVLLMASFLAGPLAWGLNLQIGYALVKWACSRNQVFLPVMVAWITLAAALWGAWIGWRCMRQVQPVADESGSRVVDRSYFLAVVAVGLDLLIAFLIALTSVHYFMLSPCE